MLFSYVCAFATRPYDEEKGCYTEKTPVKALSWKSLENQQLRPRPHRSQLGINFKRYYVTGDLDQTGKDEYKTAERNVLLKLLREAGAIFMTSHTAGSSLIEEAMSDTSQSSAKVTVAVGVKSTSQATPSTCRKRATSPREQDVPPSKRRKTSLSANIKNRDKIVKAMVDYFTTGGVIGCLDTLEPTTASKDELDAASAILYIYCASRPDNFVRTCFQRRPEKIEVPLPPPRTYALTTEDSRFSWGWNSEPKDLGTYALMEELLDVYGIYPEQTEGKIVDILTQFLDTQAAEEQLSHITNFRAYLVQVAANYDFEVTSMREIVDNITEFMTTQTVGQQRTHANTGIRPRRLLAVWASTVSTS
ncbi:hypothetical protein LTS15_000945 [Exophiala xenobiotica]|nr:hypothetical protein LTS15_000945 [Exophiala xenobiotica]